MALLALWRDTAARERVRRGGSVGEERTRLKGALMAQVDPNWTNR